ncbi:PEP-CTERM sorting domain-containing protein [Kiritimatiella glycovorans]|uniref:Ice-binding protein C-terminal domain-containing protein n=1 Tax=Kiritimatiella glycovorans TaxID=1307763 RepID=A0A0G3EIY2_9BACT|nr:PEP-CTERM sorting domain-containing protein [Kiritimatiella glycovorans]AKJ65372.1 hypothetical protein L21SP4_02142 [Kiritimatiella glycovorans]
MKKMMGWVVVLFALVAVTAMGADKYNNVWTGDAGDNDWNNDGNWWNSVSNNALAFLRGDNVDATPSVTNVNLSTADTVLGMRFQETTSTSSSNVSYRFGGAELTLDGSGTDAGLTELISWTGGGAGTQTFENSVVLNTINNANHQHIASSDGGGNLVFAGGLAQAGSSSSLGIYLYAGDVEISGGYDGSSKLTKIHDRAGAGILKFTGTGAWSGGGTVQVGTDATVLLAGDNTDSTRFAPGILHLLGGTLRLGNDEQVANGINVAFRDGDSVFDLDGNTETVASIAPFQIANFDSATIMMGDGGVLNLGNQTSGSIQTNLTIMEWNNGSDHIYVTGSMSSNDLALITFDGYDSGAFINDSDELLPTAIPEPATLGLFGATLGLFYLRRRMRG